jgi:hypothetical protein
MLLTISSIVDGSTINKKNDIIFKTFENINIKHRDDGTEIECISKSYFSKCLNDIYMLNMNHDKKLSYFYEIVIKIFPDYEYHYQKDHYTIKHNSINAITFVMKEKEASHIC